MKYLLSLIIFPLLLWGCASSIDTTNYSASEKLAYAQKLYAEEDYEDALKEYQTIIIQYPGNEVIDNAQFYLAQTRFKRGEYILAAYEFSKLIKNLPASKFVPEAQFMLAECYYRLSPNYSLDQKYTKKSISEFQAFIDFFPTDAKVPEAEQKIKELNEKLAEKEFNDAYIYEKLEYYRAALIYYNLVIDTYHDTKYAPMATLNKIKVLLAKNRNDEALSEMSRFLEMYPKDSKVKEVKEMKMSLENKLSAVR